MSQTSEVKFSRNIAALIYNKKDQYIWFLGAMETKRVQLQNRELEIIPTYCMLHLGFGF